MAEFFGGEWHGTPFQLFGTAHLIAIAVLIAVNLSFIALRRHPRPAFQRGFRIGLAILLLVNEAAWHLWNIHIGTWNIQTMLPLHLCSALVFVAAAMLITKNYTLYEFVYFLGIGGALQGFLTPEIGNFGFPHFLFFQALLSHGGIVTAGIYMTVVERYRPTWQSLKRVAIVTNIYMVLVGIVNWAIGSNYLFINGKPQTASLMDFLGPWPWYILSLEIIGVVMFLLLYAPFAVSDWRAGNAVQGSKFTVTNE